MDIGYAVREILQNGRNPEWRRDRFIDHVLSRYFELTAGSRTPVVDRDWDTLIVLDACRYDLFKSVLDDYPLPGRLSKRQSLQSGTPGFLAENFAGSKFHDMVYVTANPYVSTDLEASQFHAVDPVWDDGWDDDLQTVTPETMRERALAARDEYPNKRLVIHFVQPHIPFIGDVRLDGMDTWRIRERAKGETETDPEQRVKNPFDQLRSGQRSKEEVWAAYRSNLERAMPAVETLLSELGGKSVVTSDHGNAFGEFAWPFPMRIYGHPIGVLIPPLIQVPWHIHEDGNRRVIKSEPPANVRSVSENTAERLDKLGYID